VGIPEAEPHDTGAAVFEKGNSFSRVKTMPPITLPPRLLGRAPQIPLLAVPRIWINIDGDTGTVIFRFDGNPENIRFLSYNAANVAYALRAGTPR